MLTILKKKEEQATNLKKTMESSTEYWNMPEKGRKSQKRVNLLLLPYIALTVIGKNITKTVKILWK